tara:strand:- start:171 stop:779 length:609 start_codon:yes stop_codon:yes gene_type:complete
MNGFEAYQLYNSLRLHFSTDYDATKYNFKSRVSPASFEMKKERYFYEKFASMYRKKEDLINFYTANFIEEDTWPSEMTNQNYFDWRAKMDSISYNFNNDCKKILEEAINQKLSFNDIFDGTLLYDMLMSGIVAIETLVIFEMILKKRYPLKKISDPLGVYMQSRDKVYKYRKIIEYNNTVSLGKMAENAIKVLTPIVPCDNI